MRVSKQFDLEAFKAFVASKPADERYEGTDRYCCAIAQFGYPGVASREARELGISPHVYCAAFTSRTFGQLASRLEALEAEAS